LSIRETKDGRERKWKRERDAQSTKHVRVWWFLPSQSLSFTAACDFIS